LIVGHKNFAGIPTLRRKEVGQGSCVGGRIRTAVGDGHGTGECPALRTVSEPPLIAGRVPVKLPALTLPVIAPH